MFSNVNKAHYTLSALIVIVLSIVCMMSWCKTLRIVCYVFVNISNLANQSFVSFIFLFHLIKCNACLFSNLFNVNRALFSNVRNSCKHFPRCAFKKYIRIEVFFCFVWKMERTVRSNSKRQAKYCLLKFEVDNKTAIYSSNTLVGTIEIGERCKAFYKGKEWYGVILAMHGMFNLWSVKYFFYKNSVFLVQPEGCS